MEIEIGLVLYLQRNFYVQDNVILRFFFCGVLNVFFWPNYQSNVLKRIIYFYYLETCYNMLLFICGWSLQTGLK